MARVLVAFALWICLGPGPATAQLAADAERPRITGQALPGLQVFDQAMLATLDQHGYPGGTLAVTYQGRLVLNRAYGFADPSLFTRKPMAVDQRMRIASLSKAITAVAVSVAAQRGLLALDASLVQAMGWPTDPSTYADPRLAQITLRQLLQNHAGWVIDRARDPMFQTTPACPSSAQAWFSAQKLVAEAGQAFSYSNINFCLVQLALEKATGQAYADFVRQHIAQPLGITSWQLAQATPGPDEPAYAPAPGARNTDIPTQAILSGLGGAGAWTSSASDYLRLYNALRGYGSAPLIGAEFLAALWQRPAAPEGASRPWFYGLGMFVRDLDGGRVNFWHHGSLEGTTSFAASYANGWAVAAIFNGRLAGSANREEASLQLDRTLGAAMRASTPPQGALARP